jgi:hypothetical protein
MWIKLRNPNNEPIILNTDFIVSVTCYFENPNPNGKVLPAGMVAPMRVLNRSIIGTTASQHLVIGDPDDIYEKIKKRASGIKLATDEEENA